MALYMILLMYGEGNEEEGRSKRSSRSRVCTPFRAPKNAGVLRRALRYQKDRGELRANLEIDYPRAAARTLQPLIGSASPVDASQLDGSKK
jgi:hypothetical protein